jgi:regulator of ribonuclease activity A
MNRPNDRRSKAPPPKASTDLCDTHEDLLASGQLRVLPPIFQNYGGAEQMSGSVVTLKCFEDNALVRAMLETPGEDRVLVIDGGGSDRCALIGGNLAALAERNRWSGLVINGCVRDVAELIDAQVGVWAMSVHPRRSSQQGQGLRNVTLDMAGVMVREGDWCFADADGILICDKPL